MPPAKSKANHDDAKSETASVKERNGHGSNHHQTNGKLRRVASSTGSQLRDVNGVNGSPATAPAPVPQPAHAPGVRPTLPFHDIISAVN